MAVFRIAYADHGAREGAHVGACRERTVEVALGQRPAFGRATVTVVSRPPRPRTARLGSRRGPPSEPKTPHVVELLNNAIEWQRQLDSGEVASKAEIAQREGITRARVSQVMAMHRLHPELRNQILSMPVLAGRPTITERGLRPLVQIECPHERALALQNYLGS